MKKTLVSAAFIALAGVAGAQSNRQSQQGNADSPRIVNGTEAPAGKANSDGTPLAPIQAQPAQRPAQSDAPVKINDDGTAAPSQQSPAKSPEPLRQQQVNDDGTLRSPAPAPEQPAPKKQVPTKQERDRMAISEKGVPATRPAEPGSRRSPKAAEKRRDQPAIQPRQ